MYSLQGECAKSNLNPGGNYNSLVFSHSNATKAPVVHMDGHTDVYLPLQLQQMHSVRTKVFSYKM